ncbi:MAG: peroxiredoxin [Desulfuromonadia bacterium]
MKRLTSFFVILVAMIMASSLHAAEKIRAKVGEPAPRFSVKAVEGEKVRTVSLDDYRGKWLVLFFYPADFSFVCPTEITGINRELERFKKLGAEVLGGSVDSTFSHIAWIKRGDLGDLKFPLFSDQTREISELYGVLTPEGVALRGLFIIDPKGVVQYQVVHNLSVGRNVEEVLRVLEGLQADALCPLNWKPGQKTIQPGVTP